MIENLTRLQKFLAIHADVSRRKAEAYIADGKVLVDGVLATIGMKVSGKEKIYLNGVLIKSQEKSPTLVAFHKPVGVECTYQKDTEGKTLNDFNFGKDRLFPVGRLDKDSQGLLLLTNDGDLANHLMHPKYQHEKEYFVVVNRKITDEVIHTLGNGSIKVDGKKVAPCTVKKISGKIFTITLTEGRNRQIRKMCEHCGLTVKELLRTRIGNIQIGKLKNGAFRKLKIERAKKSFLG